MIDDEDEKQKIYIEISRDILKEKDKTNKRLRWGHILRMKKNLWMIKMKQEIYIEISGDILREKKITQTKD